MEMEENIEMKDDTDLTTAESEVTVLSPKILKVEKSTLDLRTGKITTHVLNKKELAEYTKEMKERTNEINK